MNWRLRKTIKVTGQQMYIGKGKQTEEEAIQEQKERRARVEEYLKIINSYKK